MAGYDLGKEENDVLHSLLTYLKDWDTDSSSSLPSPKYNDIPATPELAVLSQIAHELGHVLFYDIDAGNIRNQALWNCFYNSNSPYQGQWKIFQQARRWVTFNDDRGNKHKKDNKNLTDIDKDEIHKQKYDDASKDIYDIVSGDWASVFAAVSPEEDFVETYKAMALKAAGVAALNFNVTTTLYGAKTVDFLSYLGNPGSITLKRKAYCISLFGIAP
jgi:hypothetical protein